MPEAARPVARTEGRWAVMFTPEDKADGVIFDAAREAGFEDGVDFKVAEGARP